MNNKKSIFIYICTIIITALISSLTTYFIVKSNNEEINSNNEQVIKESQYTLEELYTLTEDPTKYMEMLNDRSTNLAYTIVHFYDYFDKSTPFKVAVIDEWDGGTKYTLKETYYINYNEFNERLGDALEKEQERKETC